MYQSIKPSNYRIVYLQSLDKTNQLQTVLKFFDKIYIISVNKNVQTILCQYSSV